MRIVRSAFLDRISRRAGVFWDAPPKKALFCFRKPL